ncbi:MAG TPA: L-glutamate gamma-semialdehyde dehydrogenase, partial [Actinobacteria bacterium]|nr:L-glutamate gamma-semialdehyde dehydrogenase [Actinomycetota bacterium]
MSMFEPYRPEPYSDFTDPARRAAYELALAGVRSRFGAECGLVIDGAWTTTGAKLESLNPARPSEVVGVVAAGGVAEAERALQAA